MKKIKVFKTPPAILTKDREWAVKNKAVLKEGAVIILPEDAVLIEIKPKLRDSKDGK